MRCPKCGNELKRSQKNPEYGLCYNCKLKFKWIEEPTYFDEEEEFEYSYTEPQKELKHNGAKAKKEATKICKQCKSEIPQSAKFCPNCRKKQKKGILSKIAIIFLALTIIGFLFGSDDEADTGSDAPSANSQEATEEKIEYTVCTLDEMNELLDSNAAKAAKEYENTYIEFTGILNVIDSDLSYIDVTSGDEWEFNGITCCIMNEEQENKILEMEIGDEITIQGKCTDVGEVIGFYLDIDHIK